MKKINGLVERALNLTHSPQILTFFDNPFGQSDSFSATSPKSVRTFLTLDDRRERGWIHLDSQRYVRKLVIIEKQRSQISWFFWTVKLLYKVIVVFVSTLSFLFIISMYILNQHTKEKSVKATFLDDSLVCNHHCMIVISPSPLMTM